MSKVEDSKVIEMDSERDLIARREKSKDLIANAKEFISEGLHGKITKKLVLMIPVSLIKVDHKAYQREEKKHVVKMVKEWDDSQCTMLLVNYRSEEGWFYVIDGQHRTVAAKILGIERLVCEVFIDLSVEEEAERFLYYNTGTKSLSPFDTFKANICRKEANDTAIKEVCDKYEIAIIDRKNKQKSLRSVTAARSIYKNGGTVALNWIFSLIEEVHWEDFKESYSADILMAFTSVYTKYIDGLAIARKNLLDFMRTSTPSEIIGIGNSEYPTQGHSTRTRLVMEEIVMQKPVKKVRNIA